MKASRARMAPKPTKPTREIYTLRIRRYFELRLRIVGRLSARTALRYTPKLTRLRNLFVEGTWDEKRSVWHGDTPGVFEKNNSIGCGGTSRRCGSCRVKPHQERSHLLQ